MLHQQFTRWSKDDVVQAYHYPGRSVQPYGTVAAIHSHYRHPRGMGGRHASRTVLDDQT